MAGKSPGWNLRAILFQEQGTRGRLPFFFFKWGGKKFFNRLKHKTFNCLRSLLLSPLKTSLIMLSHVRLFTSPWNVTRQALLSMGFPRQDYRSGLPCRPLGELPSPGIKPVSPTLKADSLPAESSGKPWTIVNSAATTNTGVHGRERSLGEKGYMYDVCVPLSRSAMHLKRSHRC